ncbi:MAG: histidine--tRNA ligase [Streptococcaceae bacterium]|nr:histidine--tRNA ligase [Streptococcaceae bacterium]MCH4176999.1 histidine--tRNA ligase [Streptococcaceae bacterium]
MKLQRPKGTNDILPVQNNEKDQFKSSDWQFVEETARLVFNDYQFQEIRTPIFENYEVISRSVGDTTDIVTKEMYDFYDKGNRHITLRPEGTAPVVRAYVEHKLFAPEHLNPTKLFYQGPMFRYERPQAGRLRQFHQIGAECFGSANPATDAEMIAMAMAFFEQLGLTKIRLVINSLGDPESRSAYRQALINYLEPLQDQLSEDSKRRLHENPLRVLDSKDRQDKVVVANAPSILDYLNAASFSHFEAVKAMLEALGIDYEIDSNMVRGLDYYNHTIFEIMSDATANAQTTICAGGRYDGLVEYFDGPPTPGFGFALGIERVLLTIKAEEIELPTSQPINAYVVVLGETANLEALKIVQAIRSQGFSAERDMLNRKAKAQFKTADRLDSELIITIGENELATQKVKIKNAETREEKDFDLSQLYANFAILYDEMVINN